MRGDMPDVVPIAPLIHSRYAHKLLGRSDWRAVFEVHQMIGSCHHRGPIGVGRHSTLPDGWGRETVRTETAPDGRTETEWIIRTPHRIMKGRDVHGMIPHDPLVGKTIEYPVKDVEDWRAFLALLEKQLEGMGEPVFGQVQEAVKLMGEDGVPSVGIGSAYTHLGSVRGMEQLVMDFIDYPDLMRELFSLAREIEKRHIEAFIASPAEVGWLDICWATGSDLGPQRFAEWALGDVIAAMEVVSPHPGKYLGLYTLGRIRDLCPMLVDTGVHFIETFEPNQGDITLAEAKRLYGDRTCLMGNFDCLILAYGTIDNAREEARRCLREGMEGGRYVMVTGDEVPTDAKLDNLKAMVETVQEEGRY
ncbi:MAG: uroporphyrinogen decarboxylase family protein [Candidatus Zipacnadales bacterium]